MSSNTQADVTPAEETDSAEQTQKSFEYRMGMKYQTMFADNRIVHESDVNLLPEGATIIKSVYESTYEQESYIVQHDYEMIIYKDKDGIMRKGYFPKDSAETREQGKDADVEYFITNIGRLYDLEEQFRVRHLTPQQIQQERQGEQTSKIIQKIRLRLDKLLSDTSGMRGDLMNKAFNYLKSFWNQLILYLKDGPYSIDRSAMSLCLSKNMLPKAFGIKK